MATITTIAIPIVSIDEFFKDDPYKPYSPLCNHSLEQSPCYPVIGFKPIANGKYTIMYYCKLHPEIESIYVDAIEHPCKYNESERHKGEILPKISRLRNNSSSNHLSISGNITI